MSGDYSVIIVSAGSGSRFGKKKQFCLLDKIPLFLHSYLAFHQLKKVGEIIYVIDFQDEPQYRKIIEKFIKKHPHQFKIPYRFVAGGAERYQSVYNGLQHAQNKFVFIHDAARPIIRKNDLQTIQDYLASTTKHPKITGAVLVQSINDTIKKIESDGSQVVRESLIRNQLVAATTPQGFLRENLLKANEILNQKFSKKKSNKGHFPTDDVEIYTQANFLVKCLYLKHPNPKVTYPLDLDLVQRIYFQDKIFKERLGKQ